jgi:hypothetical protein
VSTEHVLLRAFNLNSNDGGECSLRELCAAASGDSDGHWAILFLSSFVVLLVAASGRSAWHMLFEAAGDVSVWDQIFSSVDGTMTLQTASELVKCGYEAGVRAIASRVAENQCAQVRISPGLHLHGRLLVAS